MRAVCIPRLEFLSSSSTFVPRSLPPPSPFPLSETTRREFRSPPALGPPLALGTACNRYTSRYTPLVRRPRASTAPVVLAVRAPPPAPDSFFPVPFATPLYPLMTGYDGNSWRTGNETPRTGRVIHELKYSCSRVNE